ncbi:hypothetical protein GCM10009530_41980 [Microbispora corallina]|uniref:Uncharacterized protein n=1 Tax=Microbispora corallina TaxID=83302 RepID=A0ABQ4G1C0_9ACTN|nr:hypothetical protein Mco01_38730 [Microbispora corallina]
MGTPSRIGATPTPDGGAAALAGSGTDSAATASVRAAAPFASRPPSGSNLVPISGGIKFHPLTDA